MTKLAELRERYGRVVAELQVATSVDGIHGLPDCTKINELSKVAYDALTALDTLEQALRDDVQKQLDKGFYAPGKYNPEGIYDVRSVNFAHRKLAEILDSSSEKCDD